MESKDLSDNSLILQNPKVTVDTVIFSIREGQLYVLLVKRCNAPFKGEWSLVGGYINPEKDLDIEATAKRKLEEKTGVKISYLEQFGTIGNEARDPRGWSVTVVYFALIDSTDIELKVGANIADIKWSLIKNDSVSETLAFDHAKILSYSIERLRNKVLYTSLPAYLMPQEFTLGELQKVYEVILGKELDDKSFRRRMISADILEETSKMRRISKKPAKLYRLKGYDTYFFMRNIEGAS